MPPRSWLTDLSTRPCNQDLWFHSSVLPEVVQHLKYIGNLMAVIYHKPHSKLWNILLDGVWVKLLCLKCSETLIYYIKLLNKILRFEFSMKTHKQDMFQNVYPIRIWLIFGQFRAKIAKLGPLFKCSRVFIPGSKQVVELYVKDWNLGQGICQCQTKLFRRNFYLPSSNSSWKWSST